MKYILIICFLISSQLFSQEKKVIYVNENYQKITKAKFLSEKRSKLFIDLYFENDTLAHHLLVRREPVGKLNKKQFEDLKESLSVRNTDKTGLIVIIYYPGQDRCNKTERNTTWNIFDKNYLRKLKQISSISHHWIYKDFKGLEHYYSNKIDWQKDTNQYIQKTFFKYHYSCFSCVIIDDKGNYIAHFGEFGKETVWRIAKKLKKMTAKAN